MSDVTLIRPPAVASRFAYSVGIVPPLGVAYLGAALLDAGHRVRVIDAVGEAPLQRGPTSWPDLVHHGLTVPQIVDRLDPDTGAVGVSVMFSQQWPHVADIVRAVHARLPGRPIFVGGEHVTGTWRYVLDTCPAVTACAFGEGEETIVDLAAVAAGVKRLGDVAGIALRRDGRPERTAPRQRIRDPGTLARPAWHLVPVRNYLDAGFGHGVHLGRSMPILATRGCPYQCTFCSSPSMWTTRYSVRDVRDVVDEIASYVRDHGATNIDFYDLTAIIRRDWILEFCAALEQRGLDITWQLPTGTRSEALDAEVLRAVHRTGCRNICYAPESGSPRTLRIIKKRVTPERILTSVRAAVAEGITVKCNLMIGFPEETRGDLFQTLRFAARLVWSGVEDVPLFPFSPYPGSELYDDLRARGVVPEQSDRYFARLGYMELDRTESMSRHVGSRELAFVRFAGMAALILLGYARRPWRIWRTVRNLLTNRSESALEQRLGELLRRWRGRLRPTEGRQEAPATQVLAPRPAHDG
jgi:radical SAM superfamily enzyme YgiQ (UPF0313 family)